MTKQWDWWREERERERWWWVHGRRSWTSRFVYAMSDTRCGSCDDQRAATASRAANNVLICNSPHPHPHPHPACCFSSSSAARCRAPPMLVRNDTVKLFTAHWYSTDFKVSRFFRVVSQPSHCTVTSSAAINSLCSAVNSCIAFQCFLPHAPCDIWLKLRLI